ncbi:MAG TPA: metallophosphoesterase [Rhodocyclaceae bacterium]|nr:metallophosphoesterase [Rhodocyclaceae bacterium]HMY48553.1 metallophosphoesterase [Rhodocyclaceae bacterium]HMZ74912.1 metallophosphoesterase [Rhodocyclaceae bacterium]HNA67438.1 metallophosphoesterase [Rhodocyclaceae bacterium]HNB64351.1 metallophosphoesterase [Rhodocyclaceae bacterium]
MDRRHFLGLSALGGGVVFASGLAGCAGLATAPGATRDFYFVQMSDVHWGYQGEANPDAAITLRKTVQAVNALAVPPAFIVFTGDLTHTTDDPAERRRRMREFKAIVADLQVRTHYYLPGEHDASLDRGAAYREHFGDPNYTFVHEGVHFIALDNVSDPGARVGEDQLRWLEATLAPLAADTPIVVLTHRPLFDLAPRWDWATRDGAQVMAILQRWRNVTVFYGHIHQEHHRMTGHIPHHSAKSLIFPLPAPGAQEKRTPLPWDAAEPYRGLGFREVHTAAGGSAFGLQEFPVQRS